MPEVSVDRQGRIVLPRDLRRRLGVDGRAGHLEVVDTPDGVLLAAPRARATVAMAEDGLPSVTIEGLSDPVTNESVLQALEAERSQR